ncbi:hypothetical protein [Lewinella sp. IMCC34183]|uniref:hypothetical protein n=1 Tax=Lewinella sp. IMCC34183 TaxID=2248762 RepID=UPI0013007D2C|nr:hypothetical protein [Lewinella sp. IMCC34183]
MDIYEINRISQVVIGGVAFFGGVTDGLTLNSARPANERASACVHTSKSYAP